MRHLIVVGAGAALAQPLLRQFLSNGWHISAICRSAGVAEPHPEMTVIPNVDLTTDAAMVIGELPLAEGLVVMPGVSQACKLEKMSLVEWQRVVNGNLTTAFAGLRWGLPRLKRGSSAVVVGSVVGRTGGYGCAAYAAAKAGLVGLVRAAANENATRQVRVNLLELGYFSTGMGAKLPTNVVEKVTEDIPLGRFGTPEEFVEAVDFLLNAPFMTGGVFPLTGGMR